MCSTYHTRATHACCAARSAEQLRPAAHTPGPSRSPRMQAQSRPAPVWTLAQRTLPPQPAEACRRRCSAAARFVASAPSRPPAAASNVMQGVVTTRVTPKRGRSNYGLADSRAAAADRVGGARVWFLFAGARLCRPGRAVRAPAEPCLVCWPRAPCPAAASRRRAGGGAAAQGGTAARARRGRWRRLDAPLRHRRRGCQAARGRGGRRRRRRANGLPAPWLPGLLAQLAPAAARARWRWLSCPLPRPSRIRQVFEAAGHPSIFRGLWLYGAGARTHACMHAHTHTRLPAHTHTHAHPYTHACARARAHARTLYQRPARVRQ